MLEWHRVVHSAPVEKLGLGAGRPNSALVTGGPDSILWPVPRSLSQKIPDAAAQERLNVSSDERWMSEDMMQRRT